MAYKTTLRADEDIVQIYAQGVAKFGAAQADAYFQGLFETFEILAGNPHLTRERPEFRPPVRIHPYGSHVIVYVIEGADVLIIRVLYGGQDWERHL